MKYLLIIFIFCFSYNIHAQRSRKKQKISYAKGTLFFYWGYNRTAYTKNDIRFSGPDYDFEMLDVVAKDRPDKFGLDYFNPAKITIPQYNIRVGYYFAHHWSFSLGLDHYKYVMQDKNEVLVNGYVEPGFDPTQEWSGTYNNELKITDQDSFHYENTDGCNYLRMEVGRTDQWFFLGDKRQFVFSTIMALGAGPIISVNDFTFAGTKTMATKSLSGFGISTNLALRFEFFRHVFLQTEGGVGFINQGRVKTRPGSLPNYAKQKFGFATYNITLGALFYLPTKNGCNSCPHW